MKSTVEVRIPIALQNLVGEASTLQVKGETVAQVLDNLDAQFPGFKTRLIDQRGKLSGSILAFLNDEDIRSLKELDTPLKDGDVLNIYVILSGG